MNFLIIARTYEECAFISNNLSKFGNVSTLAWNKSQFSFKLIGNSKILCKVCGRDILEFERIIFYGNPANGFDAEYEFENSYEQFLYTEFCSNLISALYFLEDRVINSWVAFNFGGYFPSRSFGLSLLSSLGWRCNELINSVENDTKQTNSHEAYISGAILLGSDIGAHFRNSEDKILIKDTISYMKKNGIAFITINYIIDEHFGILVADALVGRITHDIKSIDAGKLFLASL